VANTTVVMTKIPTRTPSSLGSVSERDPNVDDGLKYIIFSLFCLPPLS
jgi:hypothetical protein